jgi:hypothetical protein
LKSSFRINFYSVLVCLAKWILSELSRYMGTFASAMGYYPTGDFMKPALRSGLTQNLRSIGGQYCGQEGCHLQIFVGIQTLLDGLGIEK